jgi:hypothetical protein
VATPWHLTTAQIQPQTSIPKTGKMKEAIVHPTPELHTTIHEVPIPEPGPDELVIQVIVAGSNPKGSSFSQFSKSVY